MCTAGPAADSPIVFRPIGVEGRYRGRRRRWRGRSGRWRWPGHPQPSCSSPLLLLLLLPRKQDLFWGGGVLQVVTGDQIVGLGEDAVIAFQLLGLGGDCAAAVVGRGARPVVQVQQQVGVVVADDLAVDGAVLEDVMAGRDGALVHDEAAREVAAVHACMREA